ncbi:MAG: beta-galactosidase [Clostridia bacterium]|nr:beta-galactosidase [Clostridia bacterium]
MKTVTYDEKAIYIDGKETKIVSGAIHYFRVHPDYWYDRLLKLKECGLNCVETYISWHRHEKEEGVFDFSGWLDFGRFLDIAKELGLYAIVRPGGYICSECDLGGFPWWLLRYPDMQFRCSHPLFLEKMTRYLKEVCKHLAPRMYDKGGNVIFVQIENEYGSYGNDKAYLRYLQNLFRAEGITSPLITSDGDADCMLTCGTLPDVLASVNFRWDSPTALNTLQTYHGNQPGAILELWNGRAYFWGDAIERRDLKEVAYSVETAVEGASLTNLYMFHGGTTFGYYNGSLDPVSPEKDTPPDRHGMRVYLTSYEVDAPLDEFGRRTPKYYTEQKIICNALNKKIESTATDTEFFLYENPTLAGISKIPGSLTRCTEAPLPLSMEQCNQGFGHIVYETEILVGDHDATLYLPEMRDIAHVYIDGVYRKTMYRTDAEKEISLPGGEKGCVRKVCIFTENLGRVCFSRNLSDRKGIYGTPKVKFGSLQLMHNHYGFRMYSIEPDKYPNAFEDTPCINTPAYYKFTFTAEKAQDALLYFEGFTRGVAWINGFNLGRHWDIAPTPNRLFIPAPLIKEGENEIVVFDVLAKDCEKKLYFGK